jgi:hypothetical protein
MLQTAAAQPFGHVTVFVPVQLRLEMPNACGSGQRRRTLRASIRPTRAAQARAGEIEGNRISSATRLSSSTKMPAR